MAVGITVPCSAIDEPPKLMLPRASTDDEPYAIAPCVIVKSALRHTAGGDVEGGGGDGEGVLCKVDEHPGPGEVEQNEPQS